MVIGLTAGSVWSNDVASGRSTRRFASCGINCSIGSSSWKWPSSNRRSAAQDVISFVEKTRNMWSSRNGIGASLSAPSNAYHIYQISTDEHRGRESRNKIPINVPLHGSVRRPKVVPGGCDFHVFHDWSLVHVITRPTSGLSVHDLVARENGSWLRPRVSRCPDRVKSLQIPHARGARAMSASPPIAVKHRHRSKTPLRAIRDRAAQQSPRLFDHLVGAGEQRRRHCETKHPG